MNDENRDSKDNRCYINKADSNCVPAQARVHPPEQNCWPVTSRPCNCRYNQNHRTHRQQNGIRCTQACGSVAVNLHNNTIFSRAQMANSNSQIFRPKPLRFQCYVRNPDLNNDIQNNNDPRIIRQINTNNFDLRGEFTQEFEDRIQADLEIKSIFESAQHKDSLPVSKSLPERPENPIVNDNFFKNEDKVSLSTTDQLSANEDLQLSPRHSKLYENNEK